MDVADVTRTNELVALFGDHIKVAARAEQREGLQSVLFDVPRRSVLGWRVLHDVQADFFRELFEHATPEEVGRRMRRLGSRPYALQLFLVMAGHLLTRQQRLIDAGVPMGTPWEGEQAEDLALVVDGWARISAAYRGDGTVLPGQAGETLRVLDDDLVERVTALLEPFDAARYARQRRMLATLNLCSFILHGEQRDGVGGHGPYALPDGRTLFVREITDLRNDYLPWAAKTEARNVHDAVIVAYASRGEVRVVSDMFGSMRVEPNDFHDRLDAVAVLTPDMEPIPDAELLEIEQAATAVQEELYLQAVEWDDRYKIEYAGPLYANHLNPFLRQMEMGEDVSERLLRASQAVAAAGVDDLIGTTPSIWAHMSSTEGPMFSPLVV